MRVRTGIVVVVVVALLGSALLYGFAGPSADGGTLTEEWVSDTPRTNVRNHHAIGANGTVVVAPVTGVPGVDNMTNATCSLVRLASADGQVRWRVGMPADECFSHALTEPAIDDIDGDGRQEAVVATTREALVAYDVAGREEFRVSLSRYGYSRPTIADLAGDERPEVVASDIDGGLVVASPDGTVLWRYALDGSVYGAPIVRDIDGDGTTEVLVSTSEATVVFGPGGSVERRFPVSGGDYAVAQADGDPQLELYLGGTTKVVALDGRTGTEEWRASLDGAPRLHRVVDGDGDGTPEVYLGVSGGRVTVLDAATGETEWTTDLGAPQRSITPAPAVGDVDGEADPEVVAVTNEGTVVVLSAATGDELAAYERDVPIWTFPTLTDLDGDGGAEILVRYGDGRVVALSYSAS